MGGSQKHYAMQKKSYTNEYVLYDFIHVKFKNMQN